MEFESTSAPPFANNPKLVKQRATGLPRRGKKPYPKERLRVLISVRILPATKEALLRLGSSNLGRAIDELTAHIQRPQIDGSNIPVTLI